MGRVLFGALCMFLVLSAVSRRESSAAMSAQEDPVLDVATKYLERLYGGQWDLLREVMAEDLHFRDPTSALMPGGPWDIAGRDSVISMFRASSESLTSTGFEVDNAFSSGDYAVFDLFYSTAGPGEVFGAPPGEIEIDIRGVTILRVKDGSVTEHLDHVNYEDLLAQVAAKAGSGED